MIDIQEIENRILEGKEIESIVKEMDWRDFEELVTRIIENHDFQVFHNFRFKTNRWYEIDVLACKHDCIIAVDCKHWSGGRYKKSGLKKAVEYQVVRTKEFGRYVKSNLLLQKTFNLDWKKVNFIPLIITWLQEDIYEHNKVFVVPVWRINHFLLNISNYI